MFDNLRADLDRHVAYTGSSRLKLVLLTQGVWATVEYRYSRWVMTKVRIPIIRQVLQLISMIWHKNIQMTTGIDLPQTADIGKGLYIGHFGGLIVGSGVKIGQTCNLSHGVTIGYAGRGEKWGCPVIGDRVLICVGAIVIGKIKIGDDVVIGAGSVVTRDLPDKAVAAGVPAKIINYEGSGDFISYKRDKKPGKDKTQEN
jgi:serine O-acetyltransferase